MQHILIKILLGCNLVLWPILRIGITLADGGEIAVSGFPIPWYASSVMGTGDVNVSVIFFLVNLAVYSGIIHFFCNDFLVRNMRVRARRISFACSLFVLLLPPAIALISKFIFGDWSGFVFLPWDGWDGHVNNVYMTHGVASFVNLR